MIPADLAPTQVGVTVQLPGGQTNQVSCVLDQATPQLFAVSKPYVDLRVAGDDHLRDQGSGLRRAAGSRDPRQRHGAPDEAWTDT